MNQILQYIEDHPKQTKRIIGINHEQFTQLAAHAIQIQTVKKNIDSLNNPTLINSGGGRKKKLTATEEILLTLYYLHNVPTFQLLGINFGISESSANNIFHYWLDILRELLPSSLLEELKKKENENEYLWILEYLTELELLVDSTEQRRERPVNQEKQKEYYSGKKKAHTFKNQVITTPKGKEIIDVVVGEKGKRSDINILREQQNKFDKKQKYQGDKSYQGAKQTTTPKKKERNKEITEEIKKDNKLKAQKRIFVEHIIRLIKVFGVAREKFRLKDENYEKVLLTICGLVRVRIGNIRLN